MLEARGVDGDGCVACWVDGGVSGVEVHGGATVKAACILYCSLSHNASIDFLQLKHGLSVNYMTLSTAIGGANECVDIMMRMVVL
jgi:hypothetical protein